MGVNMYTKQMELWKGNFGENYTERNTYNPNELDELYKNNYVGSWL